MACSHLKHYTHIAGDLIGDAECLGQTAEEGVNNGEEGKWITESAKVWRSKDFLKEEADAAEIKKAELEIKKNTALADTQAEIDKYQSHIDTINHFAA